jgi:hypothetical protein
MVVCNRAIDSSISAKSSNQRSDENTKRSSSNIAKREPAGNGKAASTALDSPTQDGTESLGASPMSKREAKRERVAVYNRVLSEREKATQARMEELRTSIYMETMKECTFKPTITNTAIKHGGVPFAMETLQKMALNEDIKDRKRRDSEASESERVFNIELTADGVTVFDRLYSQKDKVPKSIAQEKHRPMEARELDGCTFEPKLYKSGTTSVLNATSKRGDAPALHLPAGNSPVKASRRMSVAQMIDAVLLSTDDADGDGDGEAEGGAQVMAPFSSSPVKKKLTNSLGDALFDEQGKGMEGGVPLPPPTQPKGYSTSIQRLVALDDL